MAMEVNGNRNLLDLVVNQHRGQSPLNYSSYAANYTNAANNSTKKKETEKTADKTTDTKAKGTEEYMKGLEKLAPSVKFSIGNGLSTSKDSKTLNISPKILEKMQSDPKQEKETKELIKGIESAMNMVEGYMKARGGKIKFSHWYIDENGKSHHMAYYEHDNSFFEELSKKRKEKEKEHIEKMRENAAEKQKEFQAALEEKRTEKADEKAVPDKAEQILDEKVSASKDGTIYLYDTDIQTIMEATKEDGEDKAVSKQQAEAGANLDLEI